MNPFRDPEAWDAVTIAVSREGKSTIYSWERLPVDFTGLLKNKWDVQKAGGSDGARSKDQGYVPARPTMRWLLHKAEHYDVYESFAEDVRPAPGKKAKPLLFINHPQLQLYSLGYFNLEDVPLLKQTAVDQWEAQVTLVEWFPAPAPVKPQPKKPDVVTLNEMTVYGQAPGDTRGGRPMLTFVRGNDLPSRNVKP